MLLFLCWVLQLYTVNARFLYLYVNTCVLHVSISHVSTRIYIWNPPPKKKNHDWGGTLPISWVKKVHKKLFYKNKKWILILDPHECSVSDKKGAFLSSHLEMQYSYFFFWKKNILSLRHLNAVAYNLLQILNFFCIPSPGNKLIFSVYILKKKLMCFFSDKKWRLGLKSGSMLKGFFFSYRIITSFKMDFHYSLYRN